jgi:cytochrome b6-f complex iron-sulfur subunit
MQRKTFLKILAGGAATGAVLTFIESCKKSDTSPEGPTVNFNLNLADEANSQLVSGGFIISNQVMIINNGGTYIALSDICTYKNCALSFEGPVGELICYCCNSSFDTSGNIINGPATVPLKVYTVTQTTQNGDTMLNIQG